EARAVGLTLYRDGDELLIAGPRAEALPLLDTLREYKPELLALLAREAREVAWRVAALRPYVARLGPLDPIRLPPVRAGVPPLVSQDPATGDYTYHKGCPSCGEPREAGQIFRCRACTRAHHLVLLELREGVVPTASPATAEGGDAA
ncbi:MAG TPA: hypothetical protein VF116_22655, partial [Ktedonobacterales bacterium]